MRIRIILLDERARVIQGVGLGSLRHLAWWPGQTRRLIIAKPRGGSARTREEVVP